MSNARKFFEEMLPVALKQNKGLFNASRGSICISVEGEGAWTLRFGKYGAPDCYTEELDESADCVMLWTAKGFDKLLLSEPLDAGDEPKCYGEEKMIGVFLRMLQEPSKGQLGIRTRSDS
jgi:hypothetical protein